MKASLELQHAKMLAYIDGMGPIARIKAIRTLSRETKDMQKALDRRLYDALSKMRAQGVPAPEISEMTGFNATAVDKILNRSRAPQD